MTKNIAIKNLEDEFERLNDRLAKLTLDFHKDKCASSSKIESLHKQRVEYSQVIESLVSQNYDSPPLKALESNLRHIEFSIKLEEESLENARNMYEEYSNNTIIKIKDYRDAIELLVK